MVTFLVSRFFHRLSFLLKNLCFFHLNDLAPLCILYFECHLKGLSMSLYSDIKIVRLGDVLKCKMKRITVGSGVLDLS